MCNQEMIHTRSILWGVLVTKWYRDLTHWGRVSHICVSKLTIVASYNGLSPGRRQAFIWINAGILLTRTLGTNLKRILHIFTQENAFEIVACWMVAMLFRPQYVKCFR